MHLATVRQPAGIKLKFNEISEREINHLTLRWPAASQRAEVAAAAPVLKKSNHSVSKSDAAARRGKFLAQSRIR
jgi:hypothetical protein